MYHRENGKLGKTVWVEISKVVYLKVLFLGPPFSLSKNDIPHVISSMCQFFADDAKIFRSVRKVNDNNYLPT